MAHPSPNIVDADRLIAWSATQDQPSLPRASVESETTCGGVRSETLRASDTAADSVCPIAPRKGFGPTLRTDPDTGCRLWQRAVDKDGYGYFKSGGKVIVAHVYYYEQTKGPVPDGLELDHTCRNRRCCNPAHLEPVTHLENCRRSRVVKHMTLDKAREVRELTRQGMSHRHVAERFGISPSLVAHIVTNRVWRDPSPFPTSARLALGLIPDGFLPLPSRASSCAASSEGEVGK